MPAGSPLSRGLDGRLELGKRPALVIIDFVKAYLMERSPLYAGVEEALSACRRLLTSARRAGIPVLHTTVRYQAGGRDGGIYFRKVPALRLFLEGADAQLTEFAEGLEPLPGEIVIVKQYSSAFFGTSLNATLTVAGIDTLLIAGLSTSGCIRATTVDACQYGFIPVVVREAVGDRPGGTHDANLFDLQVKYAEVRSLRQVQRYLSRV
ncbi:MAG TPA: isochorismatase family protein [Steroidobacteraceae bacterium]|nr:isochorismatase family protein [Steroidobacteraceae bacterium]